MTYKVALINELGSQSFEYRVEKDQLCVGWHCVDEESQDYEPEEVVDFYGVWAHYYATYPGDVDPYESDRLLVSFLDEDLADAFAHALGCKGMKYDMDEVLVDTVAGQLGEEELDDAVREVNRLAEKCGYPDKSPQFFNKAYFAYNYSYRKVCC